MAKVNAPLLSFGGAGAIGKSVVFSKWRGVDYTRKYVVPANPNSANQQKTRSVFSWLSNVWKLLSPDAQAAWTLFAQGQPLTNRNGFIGQNTKSLRPGVDLTEMIMSPGAKGGIAAASIAQAVAGDNITITVGAPALPDGWAIVEAVAVAIKSGDPHDAISAVSYSATDNAAPYAPVIAVPGAGTYQCFAFFKYTKSAGSFAYSPSLTIQAVVA